MALASDVVTCATEVPSDPAHVDWWRGQPADTHAHTLARTPLRPCDHSTPHTLLAEVVYSQGTGGGSGEKEPLGGAGVCSGVCLTSVERWSKVKWSLLGGLGFDDGDDLSPSSSAFALGPLAHTLLGGLSASRPRNHSRYRAPVPSKSPVRGHPPLIRHVQRGSRATPRPGVDACAHRGLGPFWNHGCLPLVGLARSVSACIVITGGCGIEPWIVKMAILSAGPWEIPSAPQQIWYCPD